MKFEKNKLLLYAITENIDDEKIVLDKVKKALKGGITILQLRIKNQSREVVVKIAKKLLPICHEYNVPLIINDDPLAAIESNADGVHVGIEDMKVAEIRKKYGDKLIIGATAKTVEQAVDAENQGADYLGSGAVFPSPTKTNAIRITNEQLSEIVKSVKIPVVAIGGITDENTELLCGTGVSGIAVVSSLFSADDITFEADKLCKSAKKIAGEI